MFRVINRKHQILNYENFGFFIRFVSQENLKKKHAQYTNTLSLILVVTTKSAIAILLIFCKVCRYSYFTEKKWF